MTSGNPTPSRPGECLSPPLPRERGQGERARPCPLPSPSGGEGKKWGLRRAAIIGLLLGTVAAVTVWWFAFREPEPKNDVERFQGEWKLGTPDRPDITFVRVSGDRWQYISNGQEARAFRMTLNETANPKQIDLELIDTKGLRGPPVKMHGVYAFEGNKTVRLRLDPALGAAADEFRRRAAGPGHDQGEAGASPDRRSEPEYGRWL